jgi:hypothetical protein
MELYNKEDKEQEGEEDKEEVVQLVLLLAKLKDKRKKKNKELGLELLERDKNIQDIIRLMGKLYNNIVHIRKSANCTTWFKDRASKIIPLDNCTR